MSARSHCNPRSIGLTNESQQIPCEEEIPPSKDVTATPCDCLHDGAGQARCLVHIGTLLAEGDPDGDPDGDPGGARWALTRSLELREGTGLGVAIAQLTLAELDEKAGRPDDADQRRAEGRKALGPWAGQLDPPADVARVRAQLNSEE